MKPYSKLPSKAAQHRLVFSKRPIRSYLGNPSDDCADIKFGIERGVIGPDTRLTCVERRASSARAIRHYLERLPNASRTRVMLWKSEYHEVRLDRKVDCAFIDLEGSLTDRLVRWMDEHLKRRVYVGGHVTLTVSMRNRNNDLVPNTIVALRNHDEHLAWRCQEHFPRLGKREQEIGVALLFLLEQYAFRGRQFVFKGYEATQERHRSDEMLAMKVRLGGKVRHVPSPLCGPVSKMTGLA